MINAQTKLCCIIGNPVEHSLSPLLHNSAYEKMDVNYVFTAFPVTDLKKAIEGIRALNIRGTAVTIPHKQEVLRYVDEVDKTAKSIGAANTIINEEGVLTAYNTDWTGAMKALEEKISIAGKHIVVLGAGGAARAIIYGLKQYRADSIIIANRTKEKAQLLQEEYKTDAICSLTDVETIHQADVIINTTSVGMSPHENDSPLQPECIRPGQIVFDIVYVPEHTKLLTFARQNLAIPVYGKSMLVYGVAEQFELFTGQKAPVQLFKQLMHMENL